MGLSIAEFKVNQWHRNLGAWKTIGEVAARLPFRMSIGVNGWERWLDAVHLFHKVDLRLSMELLSMLERVPHRPARIVMQCRAFRRRAGLRVAA